MDQISFCKYECKLKEIEYFGLKFNKLKFLNEVRFKVYDNYDMKEEYLDIGIGNEEISLLGYKIENSEMTRKYPDDELSNRIIATTLWRTYNKEKKKSEHYICKIEKKYEYTECNTFLLHAFKAFIKFDEWDGEEIPFERIKKKNERVEYENQLIFNISENETLNRNVFFITWLLASSTFPGGNDNRAFGDDIIYSYESKDNKDDLESIFDYICENNDGFRELLSSIRE